MDEFKPMVCGCEIILLSWQTLDYKLLYCPKHAAAPDMYAVCEALRRNKNPFDYDEGVYPMSQIYAMAEAAIELATGDSDG